MPQKKWKPEDYDQQSVLQYNTAMSMLDSLKLSGDEKIIDIGCGTGKISYQIAKNRLSKGTLTGLDIDKSMIKFAENHYKSSNLSFECKDVLEMDHEDYYDVAISFWTLSWIPMDDQLTALNNIIRSLNENGYLFLMYPLKHDAYDVVNEVIKKPEWEKYFNNYSMPRAFITEKQYEEIVSNIPMEINLEKKEIECKYKDDKEMLASINCWLAHVDEIPLQEDKDKFLMDVVSSYKKHRKIDQPIMYYSTLEITGCKKTLEHTVNLRFG